MGYGNVPLGRLGESGRETGERYGLGNGQRGGRMSVIRMEATARRKAGCVTRYVML